MGCVLKRVSTFLLALYTLFSVLIIIGMGPLYLHFIATMVYMVIVFLGIVYAYTIRGSLPAILGIWVVAFVFEYFGVKYCIPFGCYTYTDSLGVKVAGVPLVVVFMWCAIGYSAYALVYNLVEKRLARVFATATLLTVVDLVLDPPLSTVGLWIWLEDHWISFYGVPLSNFLGWLVLGLVVGYVYSSLRGGARSRFLVYYSTTLFLLQLTLLNIKLEYVAPSVVGFILVVFSAVQTYSATREEGFL